LTTPVDQIGRQSGTDTPSELFVAGELGQKRGCSPAGAEETVKATHA
jgi:hypothetical protein